MKIVAATANPHKLKEFREILRGHEIVSEKEAGFFGEVEETGETFFENALLKARAVSQATGLCVLADDSGLCAEALGGAPGVYSARYAEKFAPRGWTAGNRAFLLEQLARAENRRAYFVCAVVLMEPSGKFFSAEGRTYGTILREERGENGFGYDPLFFSDELQKTFAEASEEEKNAVSHRGRALQALLKQI